MEGVVVSNFMSQNVNAFLQLTVGRILFQLIPFHW